MDILTDVFAFDEKAGLNRVLYFGALFGFNKISAMNFCRGSLGELILILVHGLPVVFREPVVPVQGFTGIQDFHVRPA